MKNLVIKFGALLVLAVIFSVVSARAQSIVASYQAKIPFDFTIGKKTFRAGNYGINLKSINQKAVVLSVKNARNRNQKEMAVLTNGSRSLTDNTVLMFDRYGSQYVLTQIVSPDFGLSAPKSKVNNWHAKKLGQPEESVAVLLIKEIGKTE